MAAFCDAQRRPGTRPRRHWSTSGKVWRVPPAQRRPGTRPRRHRRDQLSAGQRDGRSTKAGDSAPATPAPALRARLPLHQRSTKAGDSAPATLGGHELGPGHRDARSTKAGDSAPATHARPRPASASPSCSLNEGRGLGPGDTSHTAKAKAGSWSLNEGRGLGPGDTGGDTHCTISGTNAQRRPGTRPRRHPSGCGRSLNEGRGLGPGDTCRRRRSCRRPRSLNEGRGLGPGDTRSSTRCRAPRRPLNEGRGLGPGDTTSQGKQVDIASLAQRRPGTRPRRHRPNCRAWSRW